MRRPITIILLILFLIGIIAFTYLNKFYLPVQFKQIITNKTEQLLRRKVSIGDVHYNLIKGIVIDDFKIYQKEDHLLQGPPFINVKKVVLGVVIPAALKERKIIIPSITIHKPVIKATRLDKNTWDFSDIIQNLKMSGQSNTAPPFLLGGITLQDGELIYTDQSIEPDLTETITHIDVTAKLSIKRAIVFSLTTKIPKLKSSLEANGLFSLFDQQFNAEITFSNLDPSRYFPYLYQGGNFALINGRIDQAKIFVTLQNQKITAQGSMTASAIDLALKDERRVSGQVHFQDAVFMTSEKTYVLKGDFWGDNIEVNAGQGKIFKGNISARRAELTWYNQLLNLSADVNVSAADFALAADKRLESDIKEGELKLSIQDSQLRLDITAALLNARATLPQNLVIDGSPRANIQLSYTLNAPGSLDYSGTLSFNDAILRNLPVIGEAGGINGPLQFEKSRIHSEALSAIALNTPFILKGEMTLGEDPRADIAFGINNVDLDIIKILFPKKTSALPVTLSGQADIQGTFKGLVNKARVTDFQIKATVINTMVSGPSLKKPVQNINGLLNYSSSVIHWENLQGTWNNRHYTMNGELNFDQRTFPVLTSRVTADNLEFSTQIKLLRDAFQITALKGVFYNNRYDIQGDVRSRDSEFYYDLRGKVLLDLKNITTIFPELKEKLSASTPEGLVNLNIFFKGAPQNWRDWQLVLNGTSERLSWHGHQFNIVSFQYEQRDKHVNAANFSGFAYDGQITILSSAEIDKDPVPFKTMITIEQAHLDKMRETLQSKNKNLEGTLTTSLSLNGLLNNLTNIEGQGSISVTNGNLLHLNLLKGLLQILLIKEYRNIVFTDARANLVIKNQRVETNNLYLASAEMDLLARGSVGFDKTLDFEVSPKFKEGSILQSGSILKKPTSLITKTSPYFIFHLSGTTTHPTYTPKAQPGKLIGDTLKGTGDILKEGIEGIQSVIGGILE
jgi:hypothetical protein